MKSAIMSKKENISVWIAICRGDFFALSYSYNAIIQCFVFNNCWLKNATTTRFTRILPVTNYSEYRIWHKKCHLKWAESIIRNRKYSTWSVKKLTKCYHNNWCQVWHDNTFDTEHIMLLSCKGKFFGHKERISNNIGFIWEPYMPFAKWYDTLFWTPDTERPNKLVY